MHHHPPTTTTPEWDVQKSPFGKGGKVVADYFFSFAFNLTKIDEYAQLDIRIHFDSTTQHDIITSQREIFLPFTRLYFQLIPKEADKRVEFLAYSLLSNCRGGQLPNFRFLSVHFNLSASPQFTEILEIFTLSHLLSTPQIY